MSLVSNVTAARKLGNFLAGLFPSLARGAGRLSQPLRRGAERVGLVRAHAWAVASRPGQAALRVIDQFWWSSLRGDRIDWARLAPEAHGLLRAALAVAVVLVVLLPAAVLWPFPPVALSTVSSAYGPVAGWAAPPLLLAEALAWGALLSGAGAANRPALWVGLTLYLWFMGLQVGSAGRSVWNGLPVVAAALSLWRAEGRLVSAGRPDALRILDAAGAALVGAAAGLALFALTPLARVAGPALPVVGPAIGALSGLVLCRVARTRARRPSLVRTAVEVAGLTAAALFLAVARAGLGKPTTALVDFAVLLTGYLWPVWYFAGVGILFKMIKSTRALQDMVLAVVPPRLMVALVWALVTAGMVLLWLPAVFDAPGIRWPTAVLTPAAWTYRATAFLWRDPFKATVAEVMRWVFLVALVSLVWLRARRLLDGVMASTIGYRGLLAWFLAAEYVSQWKGFARSSGHDALLLLLFAVSMLWMLGKVGLGIAERGSPRWPSEARLALHGGLLLFIVLAIASRGAAGDRLVTDEIYLELFRGFVDLGFAYFFYVWAQRELGGLPIPLPALFGTFAAGAALAFALLAADKVVAAGGVAHVGALLDARLDDLYHGRPPAPLWLPTAWLALRAALVASLLALLARWSRSRHGPVAAQYLVVAAAAGLAAFSRARVDLPLVPPRATILLSPAAQPLDLDAAAVVGWLALILPGLGLGLCASLDVGGVAWLCACAAAALVHAGGLWAFPAGEAWLRSTGELVPLTAAAAALFVLLVDLSRRQALSHAAAVPPPTEAPDHPVEAVPPGNTGTASASHPASALVAQPIPKRALLALVVSASVVVTGLVIERAIAGRLVPMRFSPSSAPVALPAFWRPATPAGNALVAPGIDAVKPMLQLEQVAAPAGPAALLDSMAAEAALTLPAFALGRRHTWSDVVVQEWSFEQPWRGATLPLAATTAATTDGAGRALVITLVATWGDWPERRWDLSRALAARRR